MATDLIGLNFLAAVWLCAAFGTSAIFKLTNGERSQRDIEAYGIVPGPLVRPTAMGLPALEGAIVILLVIGDWSRIGYLASMAVLVTFAGAMALNLRRGRIISCGCGGGDSKISWQLVGRNIALAVLALIVGVQEAGSLTSIALGSQMDRSDIWAFAIVALAVPLVARMFATLLSAPFRAVLAQHPRGE